jgi:hypothetical protein
MNKIEEHIYIICENLTAKKDFHYNECKKAINKMYGAEGLHLLEIIREREKLTFLKWVNKNTNEYKEKLIEYEFDLKAVKYNQMDYFDFQEKYRYFYPELIKGEL